GVAANVTSVSAQTTTGQNWLLPSVSGAQGNVLVGISASFLSAGSYSGTVMVNTQQGSMTFTVNLTVGATPTLVATPTALNFAYQTGTSIPATQSISISSNGSPINFSVSSFTNTGGNQWLIVSPTGQQLTTPTTLTISIQP